MVSGFVVGPLHFPFGAPTGLSGRVGGICLARRNGARFASAPRVFRQAARLVSKAAEIEIQGERDTFEFRVFFRDEQGGYTSPWNDVPLYANDEKTLVTMITEIPRGTTAKMEIATDEKHNPIKQDVKKGVLRHYKYGPSLVNYGALPQTWEDPNEVNPDTQCGGDNDPVDVIDIGSETKEMGSIYAVKPFGVLALLDEGETDWKVLAINASDPKADLINSVEDANTHFPGAVDEVREWFRMYKTAEGKGENQYAFDGRAMDTQYTFKVIADTHKSWKGMVDGLRGV
mmetsp:Transcript_12871/g.26095  ORF Transcript_12871/g.26095 Transcript_12871/m.26095 type:complete len:287 (-) Transcript_12871:198-1058(-)